MSQRFRVTCFDPKSGQSRELILMASDETAVLELVQQSGMMAMSVIPEGGGPPPPPAPPPAAHKPAQPVPVKTAPVAPPPPPPQAVPHAKAAAVPKTVAPVAAPVAKAAPVPAPAVPAIPVAVPVHPVHEQGPAVSLHAVPGQPLSVAAIPVQAIPVQAIPVQAVPVQAIPVQAIPLQAVPVQAIPIQAVPVQAIPVAAPAATKASPGEWDTAARMAAPLPHSGELSHAVATRRRKRFQRRTSQSSESEIVINVVPMLDMTFQLLFFFIITFQPPEGIEAQIPLTLPPPEGKQEAALDKKEKQDNDQVPMIDSDVVVEIKSLNNPQYPGEMGEIEVSGLTKESIRPTPGKSLDEGKTEVFQKLGAVMTQLASDLKKENMSVRLRADPGVKWERVVQVADVCRKAKFLGIRFEKPGGS